MKRDFKITRISEGKVFAKEVNFDRPELYLVTKNGMARPNFDKLLNKWKRIEKNLQEYELTEESIKLKAGQNLLLKFKIDFIITGEVIEENGVKKIRV